MTFFFTLCTSRSRLFFLVSRLPRRLLEYQLTLIPSIQHGQETLDNLTKLKSGLVDRYNDWAAKYPEYVNDPSFKPAVLLEPITNAQPTIQSRDSRDGQHHRYAQEDLLRGDRERERSREPPRDYYSYPTRDSPKKSNEDARRAAEEAVRRRTDQIRNSGRMYSSSQYSMEHAGIAQRQQEAEAAAQAARREIATSHTLLNPSANGIPPAIPVLPAPVSASSQQNPVYPGQSQPPPAPPQPMQVPQPYISSTTTTTSSSSAMNPNAMPQPQKAPFVPYNPYSTSSASASANPPQRRGSNEIDAQRQSGDDVVVQPPTASFPAPIRFSTQHVVSHDPALSTKLTNR